MPNYRAEARAAARAHGLDPDIFVRQIGQESGFNPRARSPAGAAGIAQIMPATARGWHVDPMNPRAALNAAAANMARYVKQFGSYDKALRAYNAGPGNVAASHGFAETNHYVATILHGRDPGRGSSSSKVGPLAGTAGTAGTSVTTTTPGVDNSQARAALVRSFLDDRNADPVSFALSARDLRDVAPTSSTRTTPGRAGLPSLPGGGGGGGGGKFAAGHSKLLELIHSGGRGYAVKDGKVVDPSVYSAVWAGHRDHVHVAAGPKTIVELGQLAEKMGLHAGENSHFGGVSPVHVPGSYHYKNEAIDVSGNPRKMAQYAARVERIYGLGGH